MLLRTFGTLELEGLEFSQSQPLLILSYLSLEGKTSRQTLASLLWPEQSDLKKRSKSLHNALEKLFDLNLVTQVGSSLQSSVKCDVHLFIEACTTQDKKALELYRGPFLRGFESSGRLNLGEELHAWLLEKREQLHESWIQFLLELAGKAWDQSHLKDTSAFAWQAFRDSKKAGYPEEKTLRHIYSLLLETGQKRKAAQVKQEAQMTYDVNWKHLEQPAKVTKVFIGRQKERHFLRKVLCKEGQHLITLTGLGGIGKTELANIVVNDVRYHYARLALLALESFTFVDEPELLAKIASRFRLELSGRITIEAIARELGYEPSLLVIDNFEHLLHLKPTLQRLFSQCTNLSMLVTSREHLGLENERVTMLEGLTIPPNSETDLEGFSAPELILELCKNQGVDLSGQKSELLELCRRVDGLPLALHLIAPWLKTISIREVLNLLGKSLEFPDIVGVRHASIKDTLETSFHRLNTKEQTFLLELAIFEGRFGFASVNALTQIPLKTLKRFVESSLLRFDPHEATYDLHPLLKQFLKDKLQTNYSQWQHLQDSHAKYYLSQLSYEDQSLKREIRDRLGKESTNVFAAWKYVVQQLDWQRLSNLAPYLEAFCDETAQQREGLALFIQTIAAVPSAEDAWLGRMLTSQAWLEMRLGQTTEAQQHAQRALGLLDQEDFSSRSSCFITLASGYEEAGNFEAAREAFFKDLSLHPVASPGALSALMNIATVTMQLGHYDQTKEALDKAEAHPLSPDARIRLELIKSNWLAEQSSHLEARVILERLLQETQNLNLPHWRKSIEMLLARVFLDLGDKERSVGLAKRLLEHHNENRWVKAKMQLVLADAAFLSDNSKEALHYYNESLKTILLTKSVPAILLRLSRIIPVLYMIEKDTLATNLLTYCQNPGNYHHMSFIDQKSLDITIQQYRDQELKGSSHQTWLNLLPEEVAQLVVSDIGYILESSR